MAPKKRTLHSKGEKKGQGHRSKVSYIRLMIRLLHVAGNSQVRSNLQVAQQLWEARNLGVAQGPAREEMQPLGEASNRQV